MEDFFLENGRFAGSWIHALLNFHWKGLCEPSAYRCSACGRPYITIPPSPVQHESETPSRISTPFPRGNSKSGHITGRRMWSRLLTVLGVILLVIHFLPCKITTPRFVQHCHYVKTFERPLHYWIVQTGYLHRINWHVILYLPCKSTLQNMGGFISWFFRFGAN